jgi:hypothetical protein
MQVAGRKFRLGPARAGMVVTFWADISVIQLTIGGARVKTVRSHLSAADLIALAATAARPAGPPPMPPPPMPPPSLAPRSRWTGSCPRTARSTWPDGTSWLRRSSAAAASVSVSSRLR